MSDLDLESWVSNLPSLEGDLSEDQLVANARVAYERFNGLSAEDQSRVTAMANERLNITPERMKDFKPDEKTSRIYSRVTQKSESEKPALKPTVSDRPKTFEERWTAAVRQHRGENYNPAKDQSLRDRHGYMPEGRREQLSRISDIQREAKRAGKTFSQVADEKMAKCN